MPLTERPLGALGLPGQVRLGLLLGFRHYPTLLLVSLVVSVPISVINVLGQRSGSAALALALGFPVMALLNPVAKAATLVAVRDVLSGGRTSFGSAYRPVLARLGLVLLAAAAWLAAAVVGLGLLVLPALVVLIGGQCLMGAVVLERRGLRSAARRSWQLVRPAFFPVLVLFLLVEVSGALLDVPVAAAVGLVADPAGAGQWVTTVLQNVLAAPFWNAALAVLFLDRRAAVDGPPRTLPPSVGGVGRGPDGGGGLRPRW